jgi:ParB/RepB/Spo0J family partition protein
MREDQIDRDALVLLVDQIEIREQARKTFKRIEELAADIRENGQLQPVVVREAGPHRYLLMSGERRYRAIKALGQETILARVVADSDAQTWRIKQLSENLQREDYEPLELAREFARLKEEFNLSDADLAARLKVSRTWVWKQLSLLEAPEPIREAIEKGSLSATEYLNNKADYLDRLQRSQKLAGEPQDNGPDGSESANEPAASRVARVAVPMQTAVALAEILKTLAGRYQLSDIELSATPTKKELLAVLTARAEEIKKHMRKHDRASPAPAD